MKRNWPIHLLVWLALAVAVVAPPAGAAGVKSPSAGGAGKPLLVFAAASLATALDPEIDRFQQQSGTRLRIAYASSSLLARQIAFGAEADIYISAHQRWLDYLSARGLLSPAKPVALFANRLVLATARRAAKPVTLKPGLELAPLLDDGLLAMGDPDHVPLGIYGKSALEWLGAWKDLRRRIARADNASAAVALVARGETALGLVYLTDARQIGLNIVGIFPKTSHTAIVYSAAEVASSQNRRRAQAFIAYLKSPAASARFADLGYVPGPKDR